MTKNRPFSLLLNNRNFVKLWVSQMLSQMTINLMNFFVLTQIYLQTRSTIAVALLWIASALPALLFGPFSGAIVDSLSRRKALVITNLLQALTILVLLFSHRLFSYYAIVFAYWFFDQIYLPSQQASIPEVVDEKLLPAANGLFLLTQQTSILVGFGLGGVILGLLGSTITILVASICLVIAAVAVWFLPKDTPRVHIWEKDLSKFWKDLVAGFKFVRDNRSILYPLLTVISVQIFVSVFAVLMPTYTHEVLGLNLNYSGILLIIPGGLGAIIATYSLPKILKAYRKKTVIQTGLLLGGVSLVALSLLGIIPVSKYLLASIVALGVGASAALVVAPSQTLVQERTPNRLRGRVYAQMGTFLIIANCLPILLAGTFVDLIGVGTFIGLTGLTLIAGYLFIKIYGDYAMANGLRL